MPEMLLAPYKHLLFDWDVTMGEDDVLRAAGNLGEEVGMGIALPAGILSRIHYVVSGFQRPI